MGWGSLLEAVYKKKQLTVPTKVVQGMNSIAIQFIQWVGKVYAL